MKKQLDPEIAMAGYQPCICVHVHNTTQYIKEARVFYMGHDTDGVRIINHHSSMELTMNQIYQHPLKLQIMHLQCKKKRQLESIVLRECVEYSYGKFIGSPIYTSPANIKLAPNNVLRVEEKVIIELNGFNYIDFRILPNTKIDILFNVLNTKEIEKNHPAPHWGKLPIWLKKRIASKQLIPKSVNS